MKRILLIFLVFSFFSCEKSKIFLYDGTWNSIWIENAIFKSIAETGYGYQIIQERHSEGDIEMAFRDDRLDIVLEIWRRDELGWYGELIEAGKIIEIGNMFPNAKEGWLIPRSVSEKYNIKTLDDMKKNWKIFASDDFPSRGNFYAGTYDWVVTFANVAKMEIYGLDKYFNNIILSSQSVIDQKLIQAVESGQPVFAYYWSPSYVFNSFDWYQLPEPEYDTEIWHLIHDYAQKTSDYLPDSACAYPDIPINIVISSSLNRKAPDLVEVLKKFRIDYSVILDISVWIKSQDIQDSNEIAEYFFKKYDFWRDWLSPEASENIYAAMKVIDERED
ncbi:MAG: hypothetical protein JXR63_13535 [Spirochaetales bacterium]|nr:hypothetical protein [Spirochaetales bacterium]